MATIKQIHTRRLNLPLKGALRWGKNSELSGLEHILVYAEAEDGSQGVGEAPIRPTIYGETAESIEAIIAKHFAPALKGVDAADTAAQLSALSSVPNNHCAKGALDMALCELQAKSQGRTLYQAWHGPQTSVPASFILGIAPLAQMLSEARRLFEAGVRVFKVKVGRSKAHDDEILGALNHEFTGAGVTLYADANEGLSVENAAADLSRLASYGVAYVEEPLPVHLLRARSALKAAQILPLIADDSCFTLADLERELEADSFDILNIKTARSGFRTSETMRQLARAAGKGIMIGSQASAGLGTLHAAIFSTREGVSYPCELSFPLKLEHDILEPPLSLQDGFLDVFALQEGRLTLDAG